MKITVLTRLILFLSREDPPSLQERRAEVIKLPWLNKRTRSGAASQSLPSPSLSQGSLSLSLVPPTERKYLHRG